MFKPIDALPAAELPATLSIDVEGRIVTARAGQTLATASHSWALRGGTGRVRLSAMKVSWAVPQGAS